MFGIHFVLFNIRKLHKVIVTLGTSLELSFKPCQMFVLFGAFTNSYCINCTSGSKLTHYNNWKYLMKAQAAKSQPRPPPHPQPRHLTSKAGWTSAFCDFLSPERAHRLILLCEMVVCTDVSCLLFCFEKRSPENWFIFHGFMGFFFFKFDLAHVFLLCECVRLHGICYIPWAHLPRVEHVGAQRTTLWGEFSPSSFMWVPGIEPRVSGS